MLAPLLFGRCPSSTFDEVPHPGVRGIVTVNELLQLVQSFNAAHTIGAWGVGEDWHRFHTSRVWVPLVSRR
jgi:hypothetical protein